MSFSKPNASPATKTRNRVTPSPVSGMCVTCLDGCPGLCEVGQSALRGREVIYPQPFGKVTAGSEVDISTTVGAKEREKLRIPFVTGALGSAEIAKIN